MFSIQHHQKTVKGAIQYSFLIIIHNHPILETIFTVICPEPRDKVGADRHLKEGSGTFSESQHCILTLDPCPSPLPPALDAAVNTAFLMDKLPVEILTKIIDRKSRRKPLLLSRVFPAPPSVLLLYKEPKERPTLTVLSMAQFSPLVRR
jgi:hypothetical protein